MKTCLILSTLFFSLITHAASSVSGYLGNMIPSVSVAIANGAQESALINLKGMALVGIQTPAALTSTALTFESCLSDGTACVALKTSTSGTALSYTVTTSSYYAIDPKDFEGVLYLKIKSGSAEGAARILLCTLKGI